MKKCFYIAPDECRARALNFEDGFEPLELEAMDLEAEGFTNFDFWEPDAQLPSVVDSSANQPRSITNDIPVEHGDGPTAENLPIGGPTPTQPEPRSHIRGVSPAASPPISAFPSISVLSCPSSSSPPPPSPFPLPFFPQPSPFQLDEGVAMDMDEPLVLNATGLPPLHVNPFPPVESFSSGSTSATRAQNSKRSRVAIVGKRTRESSAEGDKRAKKAKVGNFPDDSGPNSSHISSPTSAIQSPEGAPTWFRNTFQMFQSNGVALGEEWSRLLRIWTQFEDQSAYTSHEKLGTLHRPKVVKDWIQRARPATWRPVIDNVADLEKSYSMWWVSLQPAWRHFEDGSLRTDLVDGDWTELKRPGVNGILNALVVLFYWGLLVVGDNKVRQRWLMAVEDCTMVLNHLI
jgi:hypothetical protein